MGALCQRCNLLVKVSKKPLIYIVICFPPLNVTVNALLGLLQYKHELPVVCFNGAGFDFHLLLQSLDSPLISLSQTSVIAKTSERFVLVKNKQTLPPMKGSFVRGSDVHIGSTRVKLKFMDAAQFIPGGSLDSLTSNLRREGCRKFMLLRQCIPIMFPGKKEITEEEENLLLSKIPYPYLYLSSPAVLQDNHPIPPREFFNNDLRGEKITDEQYQMVLDVINKFQINDFRQYTRIYTLLDSILLAVLYQNFRSMCFENYGLDPPYVPTLSSFSWQAFLYKTKMSLDHVRDINMTRMIERGVKGGVCMATKNVVEANYPESKFGFDPTKPESRLVMFDICSLYGTAMLEKLPHSGFKWLTPEQIESTDWGEIDTEGSTGYILKVDLSIPPEVQDMTQDLPFCPTQHVVKVDEISPFQMERMEALRDVVGKSFITQPKLLLTMHDKIEYVCHFKLLKYYLSKGVRLLKIHSCFSFHQCYVFRDYVLQNLELRKIALTDSLRALIKFIVNSNFGKCLTDASKFMIVRFCRSLAKARALLTLPECRDFGIISDRICYVMMRPKRIVYRYPRVIGMSILDISKFIYYRNYYDKLKPALNNKISLCYVDTDSACVLYKGNTESLYKSLATTPDVFSLSKLPKDHPIFEKYSHDPDLRMRNHGVCGLWVVEHMDILRGCFMKAKQYALESDDIRREEKSVEKKFKGMPACSLKNISFDDYVNVMLNNTVVPIDIKMIRSFCHIIYNVTVRKMGFHALNLSRVFISETESYPIGYHRLAEILEREPLDI